jgi:acetyl esterase/lipase
MATPEGKTPLRHFYGPDPSQYGDLRLPAGPRRPGTVVLLHGGWCAPKYGADNLDPAASDLAERGRVTWNIEYRRLGLGGGYPSTLESQSEEVLRGLIARRSLRPGRG